MFFAKVVKFSILTILLQYFFASNFYVIMKTIDLKGFRKSNNLTQTELGEYLGCEKAFISAVENGRSKLPKDKLTLLLVNPHGWDTTMLTQSEVSQTSNGDNTIQVSGNNVDMRNINQSKSSHDDARRIKELEERIEELLEDKKRLQGVIDKLLEKI